MAPILIFVRSVYRVAELQGSFEGKLANDEVLFMIVEGPIIIIASDALTAFHPGLCFARQWGIPGQDPGQKRTKEGLEEREEYSAYGLLI